MIRVENPYPNVVGIPFLPEEMLTTTQTMMHRAFDAGAKAQLKKVVEWGNNYCLSSSHGSDIGNDVYPIRKRECQECWQSLLDEVKE